MSSVMTGTGDNGETGLIGGLRVSKGSLRVHTYGTVDELNALLGVILSGPAIEHDLILSMLEQIAKIHYILYRIGADLAAPMDTKAKIERISEEEVQELEKWIRFLEEKLPEQTEFIIPGGSQLSSLLHIARSVCRRAERYAVELSEKEEVNPQVIVFLNRLSDYFFLAARDVNVLLGEKECYVKDAGKFEV